MSRLATAFILGYHGCDEVVAQQAVNGGIELLQSNKSFDWLGPGAYFWESDPQRAREWAEWKCQRGEYKKAAVVGAVIDYGNCLDLISRHDLELVREAYERFKQQQELSRLSLPQNQNPKGQPGSDLTLRYLDCAVIKHLHSVIESVPEAERTIQPFDTVRGLFIEGEKLYPTCGFHEHSHAQIAVRNPKCIKGIFLPR